MKPKSAMKKRIRTALVAVALLLVFSPFYIKSDKPTVVCMACHEMRSEYLSWKTSTHKKLECSKCHKAPSAYKMLWGHVFGPSAAWEMKNRDSFKTCVNCHEKIPGVVYFHSIKFPHDSHRKHINDCRFCHHNIVHGSRIEYRKAPKKETCYTCHDNKKATKKCSNCHLSFKKELPQQLDPNWISSHMSDVSKFKKSCVACHKEKFCEDCHRSVNPHEAKWMKSHRKPAVKNTATCQVCHSSKDCSACHGILREHKTEWYDGHRKLARKSTKLCDRCHGKDYCDTCHKGITTHPRNWLAGHRESPGAKEKHQQCLKCHTAKYCTSCHGGKPTLVHKGNWLSNHGSNLSAKAAQRDIASCITCHVPNFCLSCHRGVKKTVHGADFLPMHRNVSPKSMPQCKMCHTSESCNKCHKANLPVDHKSELWKAKHGIKAINNMESCTLCHEQKFCESCHSRKVPVSHEATNWGSAHAQSSRADESRCSLCHDNAFCNACHKRSRPPDHYRDNWPLIHGTSAMADMNNCNTCHDKKDCARCHSKQKTHNIPGWMKSHDVSKSDKPFSQCAQCHWLGTCVDCHEKSAVKNHGKCDNCHASMSNPKKLKQKPCDACHHKVASAGEHKKHAGLECLACHKQHTWKPNISLCATCHKKEADKDHNMGSACSECHEFK